MPRHILIICTLSCFLLYGCGGGDRSQATKGEKVQQSIRFTEVTEEAGLGGFRHDNGSFGEMWFPEQMGSGAGFFDYDGDGWLDILLVGGGAWRNYPVRDVQGLWLFKNNSDGTFSEVTREAGLDRVREYGIGIVAADYDNDGDKDFYFTTLNENLLFRNDSGVFNEVGEESGVSGYSEWSSSAIFFDADNDGWLDLYVGNYAIWSSETDIWCSVDGRTKAYCAPETYRGLPSRYYHNRGDGTFVQQTEKAGFLPAPGKSLGIAELDHNGDGWSDIVVANDGERDLLYENNGDGTFTEKGTVLGMAYGENGEARAGMGIDVGVVDSSGYPSIFVGNFSSEMVGVYRYSDKGWFMDRAAVSKIGRPSINVLTFGLLLFDVDSDTDLDLFLGNGHVYPIRAAHLDGTSYRQASQLFLNDGRGIFNEANQDVGGVLLKKMVVRGVAMGDYDRDGDLDILLAENNGPAHLWRNDMEKGNFIRVRLEGRKSNRDAIGSEVTVKVGQLAMKRRVRTGSSYLSQSELAVTFGLGSHTTVDSLIIRWPDGGKDTFAGLTPNRAIHIIEGSAKTTEIESSMKSAIN